MASSVSTHYLLSTKHYYFPLSRCTNSISSIYPAESVTRSRQREAKWEKFPHNPIIVHSSVTAHWLWQRGRCSEMLWNLKILIKILTTKSRLDLTWLFKSFPWPERPGCNNFLSSVPCQTQPVTNLPSKWQIDMTVEQKTRHSLSKLGHPRGIGHLLVSTTGNLITTIIVIVVTFQEADLHHKHHEHHQHHHQESRPSPWTRRTKVSNNGRWESSISTLN